MKRALVALLLVACTTPPAQQCAVIGAVPDATAEIGCPADYAALGYEDDPFGTFAHTNTVNVIVERASGGATTAVHFIDSATWWLHFDFVYFVLEGHAPVPANDPEYVSAHVAFNRNYTTATRRYVMGKVVQHLDSGHLVYELAAGDNAGAAIIAPAFAAISARLFDGDALRYRPVSNGQEQLIDELEARGVPIVTTGEVFAGKTYQPLHRTTGYGFLRFVRAAQLAGVHPLPVDLLVLDRVPLDIPIVAGVITAEFQTPLSHVGVLARQRGIPNMALRGAWDDPRLRALEGQLVRLTVSASDFFVEPADPDEAQAAWDARRPTEPLTPRFEIVTAGIVDLATRDERDVITVGAKAANYAGLMGMVPEVPVPRPAFALPFSAFDAHLSTHALFPIIDQLARDAPAGDELERRLFALRLAIYEAPVDPLLIATLHAHLVASYGGDSVRFRSSTNAEDLPEFSGAGLYSSAGADPDDGPAATERAVKVVWASAFNTTAWLEREFYRVDHRLIRMGVLLHRAFGAELANGVALTMNDFTTLRPAFQINSQLGEVSVTNPVGDATPEQILWYRYYQGLPEYYEVLARSTLTGGAPVLADADYVELAGYLERIHNHFRPLYCVVPASEPPRLDPSCAIDIEWKLGADGRLWIKQARPLRPGG